MSHPLPPEMKSVALVAALIVASLARAAAPGVWLEVKETSNTSKRRNDYPTTWGSYDYIYNGFKTVAVKLHNSLSTPATLGVQVVFIAQTAGGSDFFIASNQQRVIDLGRSDEELTFHAAFSGEDLNLALAKTRNSGGGRPYGWVVQVWQSGQVVSRKASLPELEKWLDQNPVSPRGAKAGGASAEEMAAKRRAMERFNKAR